MPERKSDKQSPPSSQVPWQVPVAVADVPEDGAHFELAADGEVRSAVARVAGLRDLPRFGATFDVTRQGLSGLHVTGHVSATVGQNCVVTLEPLTNDVEEDIDLLFAPPPPSELEIAADADDEKSTKKSERSLDGPEPLIGGVVDLGAIATEFLILGLDPYPRKPGAVFEPPADGKPEASPFAALAGLKDRDGH